MDLTVKQNEAQNLIRYIHTYNFELFRGNVAIAIKIEFAECSPWALLPFLRVGFLQLMHVQSRSNKFIEINDSISITIHLHRNTERV